MTPKPVFGERVQPNPLNWFRSMHWGKGNGTRHFYNEVPEPHWFRHKGHIDQENKDDLLYSFTHGDSIQELNFGIDTSTEEGRKQFMEKYNVFQEIFPETLPKNVIFPHEMPKTIPMEAHFRRVWHLYRAHALREHMNKAVSEGKITPADRDAAARFVFDRHGRLTLNAYVLAGMNLRPDLVGSKDLEATRNVFKALGLQMDVQLTTAQPFECQLLEQFDHHFKLTEDDMRANLTEISGHHIGERETTKHFAA